MPKAPRVKSTAKATPARVSGKAKPSGNSMWGGHYALPPSEIMRVINSSIGFDRKLYRQDIAGSLAHAEMLAAQKIISKSDLAEIKRGLRQIEGEIAAGNFTFTDALEDIHMHIESRLAEIIGEPARRLHTGRSRNDQVATDFRLYVRDAIDGISSTLKSLHNSLLKRAEQYADVIMPGFTHLQTAQPVTFGHHLMAYAEMFYRDYGRMQDARKRLNECPLGSAALAGSTFPLDRAATAKALGFDRPTANSLDAVSDRDFALEFLAAASITAMHLSRLGEEIVLWCSAQFGFIKLSEAFTTGSSIMPQKRNPDAAELIRGKAGRIYGALNSLLVTMKGLPLAYSKDMQEDKEPLFDAVENLTLCLNAADGMINDLEADEANMLAAAGRSFSTATDLADWLVRELGIPFREAHHVTGRLVRAAETRGCALHELPLEIFRQQHKGISQKIYDYLTVEKSVRSRDITGGTAPKQVKSAIKAAGRRFK